MGLSLGPVFGGFWRWFYPIKPAGFIWVCSHVSQVVTLMVEVLRFFSLFTVVMMTVLLTGVYTCYKPFLTRDKTLLKRLVKVVTVSFLVLLLCTEYQ